ncbi:MAG: magnesium-translocating P-type ATPase [Candidatus Margulisiibacteriota bacterium]
MTFASKTNEKGLSVQEASERLKKFGYNEIAKKKKLAPLFKFLSYFKDPLVMILIVAAIISGVTGEIKGMSIILSIVFLSVAMNFYQEHKSNQAAEKIAHQLTIHATVLRDGKAKEIPTRQIVPGDIVLLSAGDIVPADGELIKADDLFINESALTGESFPIEKTGGDKALSGTNIVSGYATLLVNQTGRNTEFGRISERITAPETVDAFEVGIKKFGYLIIRLIFVIVLVVFLINALKGQNLIDTLVFSLAIAVGLTPELLPMILSINMAKGSINMAKKGVLVKKLGSIPDFGSMDILCTDKTGTLTEDRITLVKHVDVLGNDSPGVLRLGYINGYFETGIRSILDKAILDFGKMEIKDLEKVDEIPYDFIRKRSSIIYNSADKTLMVTKGAPEEIFKICSNYKTEYALPYDSFSRDGFRVLAIATKEVAKIKTNYPKGAESEMRLEGFLAFYDPPKKGAEKTLAFMKSHGIEVKILTGDSPLVTQKICQDLGIPVIKLITGDELDKLGDEAIHLSNIFARISPIQKERIITVLQKKGAVVGYLGDGINDAPSLKSADVGISVVNAVDISKETADIILLKKGLKELMDGVIEGRKIFGNTMKYMMMGLSSNFGNMFSMIGAALFIPFFPMLPGQILVNNLLYDASQLAIPMDNVDREYLKKPKHWDLKFIRNFMLVFGPISSIFDFLTFYLLYSVFGLRDSLFQTGWFIESLATQTFVIYIIRTRLVPFFQSRPDWRLVLSTLGAVSFGVFLVYGPLNHFLGFTPLSLSVIFSLSGLVIAYLILIELAKRIFYSRFAQE